MNELVNLRKRTLSPQLQNASSRMEAPEGIMAPSRDIRAGLVAIGGFFILFLGSAAIIRVDAGVHAQGRITVSGYNKKLQHKDGGVISAINVKEGDHVSAGQHLLEVAGDFAEANSVALNAEYVNLRVQEARLLAETRGAAGFTIPQDLLNNDRMRTLAQEAYDTQRRAMAVRRAATGSQVAVLKAQQGQVDRRILGNAEQIAILERRRELALDELETVQELEAKGYAPKTRVRSLQQNIAAYEGDIASLRSTSNQSRSQITESRMRESATYNQAKQDTVIELRQTQERLAEITPKKTAADTEYGRTQIIAPISGRVVGLSATTLGGVITPGEAILEIVPDSTPLVIEANVLAQDGDNVRKGQEALVRFTALETHKLPMIKGKILDVSADTFEDKQTGRSFYRIQIEVSEATAKTVSSALKDPNALKPGLPAEVVVPIRKRTLLEYLIEPLSNSLWTSFRS